jgi:hypothetical protein
LPALGEARVPDLDAKALTEALGGRWHGHYGIARCPAHDDRHASLSIGDGKNGCLLLKCHTGCDWRDIKRALVDAGLLPAWKSQPHPNGRPWRPSPPQLPTLPTFSAEERDRFDGVDEVVAKQTEPAVGTVVETYLRNRAISTAIPPDIRCVPARYLGQVAYMVAVLRQLDGEITACQTTALYPDGSDRLRRHPLCRMTRGVMGTGAVRLALPTAEDGVLGLAGGVETGLSAMELCGVPVWATLGEERLCRIAIPSFLRTLIIFGDADEAGRRMADQARDFYRAAANRRFTVEVRYPPVGLKDFNDALRARKEGGNAS